MSVSLPNIIPFTWSVMAYCSCPSFSARVSFTCKLALKILSQTEVFLTEVPQVK